MTTKKYSIEEAAQHLLKVLREAESGQDVYITVENASRKGRADRC